MFVMREVAAECERPVLLFSGGKDSAVLLRLAEKAFRPGRFPFPVMHVDTGHNFDEVLEYRDKTMADLGEELLVASVQDSIDRGRVADPGPGVAQPAPERDASRRHHRTRLRRLHRRGTTRRGQGARQGAGAVVSRLVRPMGPRASGPSSGTSTTGRVRTGEHLRAFPCRTGPSSTSGSTSRVRTYACRRSISPIGVPWSSATACCWRCRSGSSPPRPRSSRTPRSGSARWATPPAPGRCARRPAPSTT